jgi:cytoskeletal protein RodZ
MPGLNSTIEKGVFEIRDESLIQNGKRYLDRGDGGHIEGAGRGDRPPARTPTAQGHRLDQERTLPEPSTRPAAPVLDAHGHPSFDPGLAQGRFFVDSPQEQERPQKKLWLWGVLAGISVIAVIVGVTWMTKPSPPPDPDRPTKIEPAAAPVSVVKTRAKVEPEAGANDSDKKTSVPSAARSKTEAVKTSAPIAASSPARDAKATVNRTNAAQPTQTTQSEPTRVSEQVDTPAETPKPPPPVIAPPPTEAVTRTPWRGDDSGQLLWRGGSLAPGATVDLTRSAANLNGVKLFPWLTETKVQVQVTSPQNVVVEVQPSRANSWNLIRLRNKGPQPVNVVQLTWQIVE